MRSLTVSPSKTNGSIFIPPSKSHTLRAIFFSIMASGVSHIENYLDSPDTDAMLEAAQALGAGVRKEKGSLYIKGTGGDLAPLNRMIDAGNSGQVLRFIGALSALIPSSTTISGDPSIKTLRTVQPLIDALNQLGGTAYSLEGNGHAPLIIQGPIGPGIASLCGKDSQPVSAMLMACSFLKGTTVIEVTDPGETPWIDLTLYWLRKLKLAYKAEGHHRFILDGHGHYPGFHVKIPGDFSSAAFPIAAALITRSGLTLENLDRDDVQGDKKLIDILIQMGGDLSWQSDSTLSIKQGPAMQGMVIDINDCIDALPILAVIGCYAKGVTHITNAAIARKKESDRISSITKELRKMGGIIEEFEDGMKIYPCPLKGAVLESHRDHRIAMALAVGALSAEGSSCIQEVECINKTYKQFCKDFQNIGCGIKEV
ncbi:MAG: 3-phosphoshikimate 1-carboxyvinyltransferase [Chlamydiia bacterium]|nr:3-phosphoshikimate 1-carboxyvinyltransferase [Chlamydiia bacterium]